MITNKEYFLNILLKLGANENVATHYVTAMDAENLWSKFPEDLDVVWDFKRFAQALSNKEESVFNLTARK